MEIADTFKDTDNVFWTSTEIVVTLRKLRAPLNIRITLFWDEYGNWGHPAEIASTFKDTDNVFRDEYGTEIVVTLKYTKLSMI